MKMSCPWDSLPVEIQVMIFTNLISPPYTDIGPSWMRTSWGEQIESCLSCLRVCRSWNMIVLDLLPRLVPAQEFLMMGLESLAFEAIRRGISQREHMIAKAQNSRNMDDSETRALESLIVDMGSNLVMAGTFGFVPCMKLILENVPELPERLCGVSILYEVAGGYVESGAVELLLDQDWVRKGTDMDLSNDTPLVSAMKACNYRYMEILLNYGARTDIRPILHEVTEPYTYREMGNGRLLTFATLQNDAKMLKILLEGGLNPESEELPDEINHLCIALDKNNLEIAQILLDHGANINFEARQYELPLTAAIRSCELKMVEKLLDLGANMYAADYVGPDALSIAIEYDRQDVFTFLLGRGATIAPHHLPRTVGQSIRIAEQIIDIQSHEDTGPALFAACEIGLGEYVQLFLDRGADPNSKSGPNGMRALEVTYEIDIVEMLLEAGADVNTPECPRERLLALAVCCEVMKLVKTFIDAGAEPCASSLHHEPALVEATLSENVSLARFLLEHGVEVNRVGLVRSRTQTPLSIAITSGNHELQNLLISWGGLTTEDFLLQENTRKKSAI